MSSRRPSPSPQKRSTALKRVDGEPLTRFDIQYDVLYNIFHDTRAVFTDPYSSSDLAPKITFRDLYLTTIRHSPKATKALKDKMSDSEMFSEDFAMLALLVNVGRVNTTMSFFPEMKTAIRTYHPIPALQRTTGNLQDAPRIKHILKSSTLKDDAGTGPSTPADILSRVPIGHAHFSDKLDFIDLFTRENVSSISRARAFLWLCFHYLESAVEDSDDDYDDDGPTNPFADNRRGNFPTFSFLSDAEILQENLDPDEEKALAAKLVAQRVEILKTQGTKESIKQSKSSGTGSGITRSGEGRDDSNLKDKRRKEKKAVPVAVHDLKLKDVKDRESFSSPNLHETDDEYDFNDLGTVAFLFFQPPRLTLTSAVASATSNQYPKLKNHYQPSRQFESHQAHHISSLTPEPRGPVRQHRRHRYSPYPPSPKMIQAPSKLHIRHRGLSSTPPLPRSMLEQVITKARVVLPSSDEEDEKQDESVPQRRKKGKTKPPKTAQWEYYVKWANYDSDSNSWEPAENVAGCQRLLASFWKHVGTDNKDYEPGYQVEAEDKWIKQEKRYFQKEYNDEKEKREHHRRKKTSLALSDLGNSSDDDMPLISKRKPALNESSDDDVPLSKFPPRKTMKTNSSAAIVTDPASSKLQEEQHAVSTRKEQEASALFSSPEPEPATVSPAPLPPPPPPLPGALPTVKPASSRSISLDNRSQLVPEHALLGSGLSTKQRLSMGALAPRAPKAMSLPQPKPKLQLRPSKTASSSLMPLSFKKKTTSTPMISAGGSFADNTPSSLGQESTLVGMNAPSLTQDAHNVEMPSHSTPPPASEAHMKADEFLSGIMPSDLAGPLKYYDFYLYNCLSDMLVIRPAVELPFEPQPPRPLVSKQPSSQK
ncbi:hypothetical protein H0H87_011008 [Tephrocybe sp. NHM501043]|nr:hypothetical protein H0H87_011008 [Tephrocybe sp. NHM501043]